MKILSSSSSHPEAERESGEVFIDHKTFLELHNKTVLQCSPKQLKKMGTESKEF